MYTRSGGATVGFSTGQSKSKPVNSAHPVRHYTHTLALIMLNLEWTLVSQL